MITDINQLDFSKKYTYADYLAWRFKERVELIRGKILQMSPAPNRRHQKLSLLFERKIDYFLVQNNNLCEMYHAPFDVRLPLPLDKIQDDKIDTVVQPDLCVICDLNKLDDQGCIGAPEFVIEILSPGNSSREMKDKFYLYESAGVLEYWIVDPTHLTVHQFYSEIGKNKFELLTIHVVNDSIASKVLSGFEVQLDQIF